MEFSSPKDSDSHHASKKLYFPFIYVLNILYETILVFPLLIFKLSNQLNSLSDFSNLALMKSKEQDWMIQLCHKRKC